MCSGLIKILVTPLPFFSCDVHGVEGRALSEAAPLFGVDAKLPKQLFLALGLVLRI